MAAPYAGKTGTFYISRGDSTRYAGEGCTQVGSTNSYYITDRTKAWWDPAYEVVAYDGGVAITTGYTVDYAGGYVNLSATPTGAVTVDAYAIPMEQLGGVYGWSASKKAGTADTTTFPAVAGTLTDKSFIGIPVCEWSATCKRHWWYARATVTTSIAGDNNDLTWTWIDSGSFGNSEAIKYESGAELQIARADNETVVTYVAATSTASDVKSHLEADTTLDALWELSYPVDNDGTGVVGDVAHTHASGGRDSLEQISSLATKVLCVFYLENDAATSARLEGVGIITGLDVEESLESIVEVPLTFQGTGALCYHAV